MLSGNCIERLILKLGNSSVAEYLPSICNALVSVPDMGVGVEGVFLST